MNESNFSSFLSDFLMRECDRNLSDLDISDLKNATLEDLGLDEMGSVALGEAIGSKVVPKPHWKVSQLLEEKKGFSTENTQKVHQDLTMASSSASSHSSAAENAQKKVEIVHEKDKQRFVHKFSDGSEALVSYELRENDSVADFTHTFVPEHQRGFAFLQNCFSFLIIEFLSIVQLLIVLFLSIFHWLHIGGRNLRERKSAKRAGFCEMFLVLPTKRNLEACIADFFSFAARFFSGSHDSSFPNHEQEY